VDSGAEAVWDPALEDATPAKTVPVYLIEGGTPATLAEILAVNEECPIDDLDVRGIESLAVGETWRIDLGAGGVTRVQRVS
jgi:hypothetical protein